MNTLPTPYQNMEVIITDHGRKRVHKRLGLPSRSVARFAGKVLVHGASVDRLDHHPDVKLYLTQKESAQIAPILYGRFVWIFDIQVSPLQAVLITAYPLPTRIQLTRKRRFPGRIKQREQH